jgi:beta-galactosidase
MFKQIMNSKKENHHLSKLVVSLFLFLSNCLLFNPASAQLLNNQLPMIGAEVFIEPGQTATEIEGWFHTMNENGLKICRIRMFENYMRNADGNYDFSLFDNAYKAGEKYGIKIWANLFADCSFEDVGGFKFPKSNQHLDSIAAYIKNLVTHFKQFKSHAGWVLINEPGSGHKPDEPFTAQKFIEWKKNQSIPHYRSNGFNVFGFENERFLLDYNTWFLKWLATEIYKYDPDSHLHVNNHSIFQLVAEYNFPEWRKFLSSLGGSAHASWHFGYFNRSQYPVALSANCEILQSGAGHIPWLMTELQGGNNIYSGFNPVCPTKEEIAQWLWIIIGSGGKGAIFWSLNPRSGGYEAGEWALLNYQNMASDRLIALSGVTKVLAAHPLLFAHSKPIDKKIHLLYTRESLWLEKKLQTSGNDNEGRIVGGVMKSVLGYFEAFSQMGIDAGINEMSEFDFSKNDYTGEFLVLAHQISIPSKYWLLLQHFVANGGKLLIDGLSGYYDENGLCVMKTGFPLASLLGGNISEFKFAEQIIPIVTARSSIKLPGYCWQGSIVPITGRPISVSNGEINAIRNKFGKGEVVWIPSLIGLGSRINGYVPLVTFLKQEAKSSLTLLPFQFRFYQPGMLMKTLQTEKGFITVIINKNKSAKKLSLQFEKKWKPVIIYANKKGNTTGGNLLIEADETMVVKWE